MRNFEYETNNDKDNIIGIWDEAGGDKDGTAGEEVAIAAGAVQDGGGCDGTASDKHVCLSFTLEDKFGDNGLICVIIMEKRDVKTLFVDTWFMSCRVLKRGMENFTLNTMVEYAKELGFERIVGEYIPTLKNGMVKEHYTNLGFSPIGDNLYELNIQGYEPRECYIRKSR